MRCSVRCPQRMSVAALSERRHLNIRRSETAATEEEVS